MSGQDGAWRAFHLFYFDDEHVDALIVEADRLIRELAPRPRTWFFIRYNMGGMHLRVRLRDCPECFDEVLRCLRDKAGALAQSRPAKPGIPAGGVPDDDGRIHDPGSVVETPYVPETDRYGGPHALPENEALFEFSTSIAVKVIGATLGDRPRRARLAIDMMLALATVATEDEKGLGRFFQAYSQFWALQYFQADEAPEGSHVTDASAVESRLRTLRDYAASDAPPATPSQLWFRGLADARRRFESLCASGKLVSPADREIVTDRESCNAAISDMLTSQMHMMNNRLGFGPYEEMMWAGALARSFAK
jgi:thiopeptide-type bacteriocin biosynthesis protein